METTGARRAKRVGVVLGVVFFLVQLLAQTASAQPTLTNTFSEMLKLVPRALRTRHHPAKIIAMAARSHRALGHLLERSLLVGAERTFQKSILPSPLLTLVQTRLART